jgi:hypothetical protein
VRDHGGEPADLYRNAGDFDAYSKQHFDRAPMNPPDIGQRHGDGRGVSRHLPRPLRSRLR